MAGEKKTEMLDPIAYRPDYNPNDIIGPQNANINYGQYGDDSNPEKQKESLGGLAEKNTGEGVANSNVGYNANIKTGDLDPNYLYGEDAKKQNAQEAGYIAKRNDNIASALYNEGKVTKDDVAMYLAQQNGFANSTVLDRKNTAESIYKRLGQFQSQNEQQEEGPDTFMDSTEGKVYGKTTAENQDPTEGINTLSDANSVFKAMDVARVSAFRNLQNMDSGDIAASIYSGTIPYGEQAFRDLQSYNFPKWQEVQDKIKELKVQDNVNKIANGDSDLSTSMDNGDSNINNSNADFASQNANDNVSSNEILESVEKTIASNTNANVASEQMAGIEEEVATLKNRLSNLRKEANNTFRGDVPDYIVQAYINNRTQEINDRLGILEDRYNAAYSRYQTELSNAQWQKEYEIKQKELALKEKYYDLEKYKSENSISSSTSTSERTEKSVTGKDLQMTNKTREEVEASVDSLLGMLKEGKLGKSQCAAGIQRYYLPMLGIDLGSLSAWEAKLSLINEEPGYMPKKGDIMIMSSQTSPMYGHMAIVTGVDEDGNIYYLDWNGELGADGKGTEEAKERVINGDSKTIAGFYNVTKGGYTDMDMEFSDYDLESFRKFLNNDLNSAESKVLAESWGTDLKGLRTLANYALKKGKTETVEQETQGSWTTDENGRTVVTLKDGTTLTYGYGVKGDDARLNEPGFDAVLGYNPRLKNVYEKILLNSDKEDTGNWLENREEFHNREKGQLWQEALNYDEAKSKGYDAYDDASRNVDETYGFVLDKKNIYETIAKLGGKIPGTQGDTLLKELGLNPKDPRAWEKANNETNKWREWQKGAETDNFTISLLNALEYMIMQDASTLQRQWIMETEVDEHGNEVPRHPLNLSISPEARTWQDDYNYIIQTLALEELIDLKNRGATFGALSDNEGNRIQAAATLISWRKDEDQFHQAVADTYYELRKAIGQEISKEDIEKMWNAESSGKFDNYLTLDHSTATGPWGAFQIRNYPKKSSKNSGTKTKDKNNPDNWNNNPGGTGNTADGASIADDVIGDM